PPAAGSERADRPRMEHHRGHRRGAASDRAPRTALRRVRAPLGSLLPDLDPGVLRSAVLASAARVLAPARGLAVRLSGPGETDRGRGALLSAPDGPVPSALDPDRGPGLPVDRGSGEQGARGRWPLRAPPGRRFSTRARPRPSAPCSETTRRLHGED